MVSVPAASVAGTFFFARSRRAAKFLEPAKKHEFSRMILTAKKNQEICENLFYPWENKPQKTLRLSVFVRDFYVFARAFCVPAMQIRFTRFLLRKASERSIAFGNDFTFRRELSARI